MNNNNEVNNANNNNTHQIYNNRLQNNYVKKDFLSGVKNNNSNNSGNNLLNNNNQPMNNVSQNIQNSSLNKNNTTNSNNSNSKITFNNNNSGMNPSRGNMPGFKPLSDSRLYEMANQYITTDESLEKFQARLKNKYGSLYTSNPNYLNSNLHVINEARSPVAELHKENAIFSEVTHGGYNREGSGYNGNSNANAGKNKRVDRLAKNIASNLEYYKMIES